MPAKAKAKDKGSHPAAHVINPPAAHVATVASQTPGKPRAERLGMAKLPRLLEGTKLMKKFTVLSSFILGIIALAAFAAQDETFRQQDVRDPRVLAAKLTANASDAETRLTAAGATATSAISLTNGTEGGSCSILMRADQGDDAGDMWKLLLDENGLLSFQTDASVKGTLASKATMTSAGVLSVPSMTITAGAGIDSATAGALKVGVTTATSVDIGVTACATTIKGTFNVDEAATFDTTVGVTGVLTASGGVKHAVAADVPVTNGQVVTLAYGINVLVGVGSAADATNVITIANGTAGQVSYMLNKTGATNCVSLAKTGNFYGPALNLHAGDSAVLMNQAAAAWYGHGDN